MLGCLADKAPICGLMWSVSWCLPLCLKRMATGSDCQHIGTFNKCRILLKVFAFRNIIMM